MPIINPRIGKFINWKNAYVGDPADSVNLGIPLVETFNHLRRYRAMEYIASYSGRCDVTINGNDANVFHIISRFPVRENGGDADIMINAHNWRREYGAVDETWKWYKDYGDAFATRLILRDLPAPTTGGNDDANDYPSGAYGEWFMGVDAAGDEQQLVVTPQAIGTDDGFRCSRLDVDNAMIHRLNVFGCPHEPTLSKAEALVSSSDFNVDEILRGWDDANSDDGTVGTLCHYMDAGDSVVHNTSRALFNTCYALGVYQTGSANHAALRQDSLGNAQSYKVKARNLTGATGDVPCDLAIMAWGGENSEVAFTSVNANGGGGDTATFVMPAGIVTPTLYTTSDFDGKLDIHKDGDYVTVTGKSAGALELHVQAVSLWENFQHR